MGVLKDQEAEREVKLPELWKLNEEGLFKDEKEMEKCLETLWFLSANKAWVEDHLVEVGLITTLIKRTKFTDEQLIKVKDVGRVALEVIQDKTDFLLNPALKKEDIDKLSQIRRLPIDKLYSEYDILRKNEKMIPIKFKQEDGTAISDEIPKFRLEAMSDLFQKMLLDGSEIEFSDEKSEFLGVFLNYLKSGELSLDPQNVRAILSLADAYNVKSLTKKCCEYLAHHLTLSPITDLLEIGFQHKEPQLVWSCLEKGLQALRYSKHSFDHYTIENEDVVDLIEDLKILANLKSPPHFSKVGWVVFHQIPEKAIYFDTLEKIFPLSIEVESIRKYKEFAKIPELFPTVQHLIIHYAHFNPEEDAEVLRKIDSLKSFGNLVKSPSNSAPYIRNYIEKLSPIKLSAIRLERVTDGELLDLSEDLKDIKQLVLQRGRFTTLPEKIQPKYLDCSHSEYLVKLSLTKVKMLKCNYCHNLKELSALEVKNAQLYECDQLLEPIIPKVEVLGALHCEFKKIVAPNAKAIYCDTPPEVIGIGDESSWGYVKKDHPSWKSDTLWDVPLDVRWNSYS